MAVSNHPTPAMIEKAHELVTQAHTWNHGKSKRDGTGFYVIPSSDGTRAHWANVHGCTCDSYRNRGACSHREAAKLLQQRSDAAISAKIKAADQERRERNAAAYARLYGED